MALERALNELETIREKFSAPGEATLKKRPKEVIPERERADFEVSRRLFARVIELEAKLREHECTDAANERPRIRDLLFRIRLLESDTAFMRLKSSELDRERLSKALEHLKASYSTLLKSRREHETINSLAERLLQEQRTHEENVSSLSGRLFDMEQRACRAEVELELFRLP